MTMPSTLVLTGHFPPSVGGVQRFTWELVRRLPADRVVVVTHDDHPDRVPPRAAPFPVLRRRGYHLSDELHQVVADYGCTAAWIPALAPIGLFATALRKAGIQRIVASTHGQELGWLRAAPTRGALRRIASWMDVITVLSPYTRERLVPVIDDPAPPLLHGGVDVQAYAPIAAASREGLRPRVVSIGRLVRRKGHDNLIAAWREVLRRHPEAVLTIVGCGPYEKQLRAMAAELPAGAVEFTGAIGDDRVRDLLRVSHVLVTPSRDDRLGLQTEGLGLSTLEGSAAGLPVVVGRSGGSADSLIDGVTGRLVDAQPAELARVITGLLDDPARITAMGAAGRAWVEREWRWDSSAAVLRRLLVGGPRP